MIASELISDLVPSIRSTDSAWTALAWMGEFKLTQLPVVDEGKLTGIVTEQEILDSDDLTLNIAELMNEGLSGVYIYEENHIYDAVGAMSAYGLEILPVLGENKYYLGVITLRDIVAHLGSLFAAAEPGAIIQMEVQHNSYVLSEIARIVESENAKILSLYLFDRPDNNSLIVTIKLNLEELSRVVASFERFKYKVIKTFHKVQQLDNYQKNLDALLKYLNM